MRINAIPILILIVFTLLTLSSVYGAETTGVDANKAFQWLVAHCENGNCGNIDATAFATLALKDSGAVDHAQLGLNYIKSREDTSQHCWPSGSCKIKDTAFALWVLNEYGEDTSEGEEYLKSAISADSSLKNFWYLEVITSNNGTCKISYDKGDNNIQKNIPVAQGTFPSCQQSPVDTFFDLNACLEPDLLSKNPSLEIDVNCNDLGPSTLLTVLFTKDGEYYLIEKASTGHEIFTIQNGCFGTSSKSSCNLEASLYTNWILSTLSSDLSIKLYLKNNIDKFKTVDNALLYLATKEGKDQYLKDLVSLQHNDGSFNKNVVETAIAVLALKQSGEGTASANAISWLESKQSIDGSWETDVYKTAVTLYAAFSGAAINLPPPTISGGNQEPVFQCGDGFCDPDTETAATCPDDCKKETTTCEVNGICETYFEDSSTCPQDCTCGDGICDNTESKTGSCDQDCQTTATACGNGIIEGVEQCDIDKDTGFGDDTQCSGKCQSDCSCPQEETSGFPWWISIVIVVLLIGIIVYYFKFRGPVTREPARRGSSSPSPFTFSPPSRGPPTMPRLPPTSSKKSRVEEELDKSIEEAKKLLRKI